MTLEESERNTSSDHILDWLDSLEGSIPFLPPFLKDPYNSGQINGDHWWVQDLDPQLVNPIPTSFNNSTSTITTATSTTPLEPTPSSRRRSGRDSQIPFRNHLKSDEKQVTKGEAAKVLTNLDEMNEGNEKWCERMRRVNFMGQVLGESTVDETRALLRNYDSNWEMRVEGKDGCVGLWWKGQPASFCSLWKLGHESK
ncbi:Nodulation-signaling pathway 1 protein [Actinidia chinensis var. chinensis]|uniref:Nodulation-signaling pathway 1 protein n=1 Tax=Actinidia chinensis var. chinensis TaxID=1590841 RepID=A0A2R6QFC3_ACTCC|nr:Nodulation-signaling pathway 1 protein [Actinidia chinensis var. chinensis]